MATEDRVPREFGVLLPARARLVLTFGPLPAGLFDVFCAALAGAAPPDDGRGDGGAAVMRQIHAWAGAVVHESPWLLAVEAASADMQVAGLASSGTLDALQEAQIGYTAWDRDIQQLWRPGLATAVQRALIDGVPALPEPLLERAQVWFSRPKCAELLRLYSQEEPPLGLSRAHPLDVGHQAPPVAALQRLAVLLEQLER